MEEGAFVKVRLGGACASCAMSQMTLKHGIEKRLMAEFDELQGVIQVL
jgi:Fe-S cluster biogenesis protein NfuA